MLDNICLFHVLLNDINQIDDSTVSNDIVPVGSTVTGNISDCPNCLFNGPEVLAFQQFDKERDSTFVNDGLTLNGGAWGDIGQCPCSLELELWVINLLDIVDHFRHKSCVNDGLDRWVVSNWQDFPDTNDAIMLPNNVVASDTLEKLVEVLHGINFGKEPE